MVSLLWNIYYALQWRHNERGDVSNHRCLDGLLKRLFRLRSKKASTRTGLYEGKPLMIGGFPSQRASYAEMFPFDDVILSKFCIGTEERMHCAFITREHVLHYWPFEGNLPVTDGFRWPRARNAGFRLCRCGRLKQAVEQAVELSVIWDTLTLLWCHCNTTHSGCWVYVGRNGDYWSSDYNDVIMSTI